MCFVVLVCLFVCLFLILSVRQQDYLQNNERICMQLLPEVSRAKEQ